MTKPSNKKRVVTDDDIQVLEAHIAYAKTQGDRAAGVVEEFDRATAEFAGVLAEVQQSAATALAAGNAVPVASLASAPASTTMAGKSIITPDGSVYVGGGATYGDPVLKIATQAGQTSVQPEWYGADFTAALTAAGAALPAGGGVIDARKWTGTQTLTANPFAGVEKAITLLTGKMTLQYNPNLMTLDVPSGFNWQPDGTVATYSIQDPQTSQAEGWLNGRLYALTASTTAASASVTVSSVTGLTLGSRVCILGAGTPHLSAQTTLVGAITAGATSLTLTDPKGLKSVAGVTHYFQIESEIVEMQVSGTDGTNAAVTGVARGALGTTAAAHSAGATVTWLRSHIAHITAINGTTLTLDAPAAQTTTGARGWAGVNGLTINGTLAVDGRVTPGAPDVTYNTVGLSANFARNIKIDGRVRFSNFDHGGFKLGACTDFDIHVAEIRACSRVVAPYFGANWWVFGRSKSGTITVDTVDTGSAGGSIDDRSVYLDRLGLDGAPEAITATMGSVSACRLGGIIAGARASSILIGRMDGGRPGDIAQGEDQWATPPEGLTGNRLDVLNYSGAQPFIYITGDGGNGRVGNARSEQETLIRRTLSASTPITHIAQAATGNLSPSDYRIFYKNSYAGNWSITGRVAGGLESAATSISGAQAALTLAAELRNEASGWSRVAYLELGSDTTHVPTTDEHGAVALWVKTGASLTRAWFVDGTAKMFVATLKPTAIEGGSFTAVFDSNLGTGASAVLHHTYNSGGLRRWGVGLTGAESSGNAGSTLNWWRYNDAGAYIGLVLALDRVNGDVTIPGKLNPGSIRTALGSGATGVYTLGTTTTADATPTALAGGITLGSSTTFSFTMRVTAVTSGSTLAAGWEIKGLARRNFSGTPVLLGTPTVTSLGADAGAAAWAVVAAISGNTLTAQVTGAAATSIRWQASLQTTEVTF